MWNNPVELIQQSNVTTLPTLHTISEPCSQKTTASPVQSWQNVEQMIQQRQSQDKTPPQISQLVTPQPQQLTPRLSRKPTLPMEILRFYLNLCNIKLIQSYRFRFFW